jgi:glutathione S-transferase
MLLVGMLDSPYVRRAAITGTLMGLEFEHRSISVFRHMEAFRAINPLVKAPSLVCDDGTVLMDSLLIIQHPRSVIDGYRYRGCRQGCFGRIRAQAAP